MTYSPAQTGIQTGEEYFTSIGLLGGSTGMVPLISARYTFPTPDASWGSAPVITDSVAKFPTGGADVNSGYNFTASKSAVLAISYWQPSYAGFIDIAFDAGTFDGSNYAQNAYTAYYGAGAISQIGKNVGGLFTQLGDESTFYQAASAYSPVMGMALHIASGNVTMFAKSGSSQWFQLLQATLQFDHTSFQSFIFGGYRYDSRIICPLYVWGAA